jgi:hypothetical protein
MGDNVESFHGVVWTVSLTEMVAAVPPHAAVLASCFLFVPDSTGNRGTINTYDH